MRAAFIIPRLSEYRLLGPVIDRALESGWRVECWHDYGRPRDGAKAYLFPTTDGVSRFQHEHPGVRTYAADDEHPRHYEGLVGWRVSRDAKRRAPFGWPLL